jgi:hypothetical protein
MLRGDIRSVSELHIIAPLFAHSHVVASWKSGKPPVTGRAERYKLTPAAMSARSGITARTKSTYRSFFFDGAMRNVFTVSPTVILPRPM